jgi:DNA-binding NarL/FixJ family response regulator
MSTSVLVACGHAATLKRLTDTLQGTPRVHVVGTASSLLQVRYLLARTRFDVLLCELRLPDGDVLPLLDDLWQGAPHGVRPRVLLVTPGSDHALLLDALRRGADGYCIDRGDAIVDIGQAVAQVVRDEAQIDTTLARRLLSHFDARIAPSGLFGRHTHQDFADTDHSRSELGLEPAERELITLLAQGRSLAAVARDHDLQPGELRRVVREVYRKMQCDWRTARRVTSTLAA